MTTFGRGALPQIQIEQSVFDPAIREINALEVRIVAAEDDTDAMLWDQARQVVAQLAAGLSQRKLAAHWINTRTGEAYSHVHVHRVAATVERYVNVTPRPRFRDAYNAIANSPSDTVNRLLYQTGDCEWYSPPEVVDPVRAVLGAIDLDPASCAAANTVVQAARFYTREDNGLDRPWSGRVFLNPPYRLPDIAQFSAKFAHHVQAGDIPAGIVLVNNATDTQWFGTLAGVASAFCFPSSRCRYWQPDRTTSSPLQGQVVVYAGPDVATFRERFTAIGLVLVR
jgi:hypothetical protein